MFRWWKRRQLERREFAALRGEQHERFLRIKEEEVIIERMKVENRRFELEIRARKELGYGPDFELSQWATES